MLSIEEIKIYLRENLKESRYNHTLGVAKTAKELAAINGISVEKAEIAALSHDVAKNLSNEEMLKIIEDNNIVLSIVEENNPNLWHSVIAPIVAKEKLGVEDEEILDAIRYHTTGKEDMSVLTKIIYISDMIEPGRVFPRVDEIRSTTFDDLDKGVYLGLNSSIEFILKQNYLVDENSIKARNYLLINKEA